MNDEEPRTTGFDRRTLLKRGAVVGGALVWATPVVQSLSGTAMASVGPGSLPGGSCSVNLDLHINGAGESGTFTSNDSSCCSQLNSLVATYNSALAASLADPTNLAKLSALLDAYTAVFNFATSGTCGTFTVTSSTS